jgi:peptide/nickel transport system substrate-binding protein
MRKTLYLFIVIAFMFVLMVGCSSESASETENQETEQSDSNNSDSNNADQGEKEISISQTYDIENLDPATITSVTDGQVAWNLYDSLMFVDLKTGELSAGLAKEYSASEDGLTYTFKLHEGVQFHKGYGEMTSEDVKFTIDRILDPETQARNAKFLKSIKEVRAVDPYTVEIELTQVDPLFLDNLAQYWTGIISKKAYEEKGDDFKTDPIGTGPFVFDSWKPQTATILLKNPDWYRQEVKIDRVKLVPIPEPSTMYLAFENGDIDIIQVTDPQRLQQYSENENFQIARVPGYIVRFIGIHNEMKPFDDVKVRQALMYGFDRETLINSVLEGLSQPATGPIPPNVKGYESDVTTYPYDPEKAKALLAEAGYPNGFDVKMTIPNIDRFIIPSTTFQADMKKIGINVEIEIMETAAYLEKTREGAFPLFSHSKGQTAVPDVVLSSLFHSDNKAPGDNLTFYDNPDVDAWLEELSSTMDEAKRAELLSKIQKQLAEDVTYLFIDHEEQIFATSSRVKDFIATPTRSLQVFNVDVE